MIFIDFEFNLIDLLNIRNAKGKIFDENSRRPVKRTQPDAGQSSTGNSSTSYVINAHRSSQ